MTTEAKLGTLAALALLLFGLGFYAGWRSHHVPPAAPARVEQHATQKDKATTDDKGPSDETKTLYKNVFIKVPVPGPPGAPGPTQYVTKLFTVPIETDVKHIGPEHIAEQTESKSASSSLTLTPPPPVLLPGWALGLSLDSATDKSSVRLEVGRRLFGQFWARASVAPLQHQVGVGLEFHF